jgi:hypothetical protein
MGSSGCEALWSSHPPECGRQCDEHLAWKRNVALEISIAVDGDRAIIRLSGTLSGETALNVAALATELIGEGHVDFELKTSALCVPDNGGVHAMNTIQRLVHASGGFPSWDGLAVNHPFPARNAKRGRKLTRLDARRCPHSTTTVIRLPLPKDRLSWSNFDLNPIVVIAERAVVVNCKARLAPRRASPWPLFRSLR